MLRFLHSSPTTKSIIGILLIITIIFWIFPVSVYSDPNFLSHIKQNEIEIKEGDSFIRYAEQPVLRASQDPIVNRDTGNIEMSFYSKKATSGIVYRTTGWMAHKNKYSDMAPPTDKRADFTGNSFVQYDEIDHGNGYVTTYFRIPFNDIASRFGKDISLLDMSEGDNFYLSSIFEVRKGAGGSQKVSGPHFTYTAIKNAAGWGSQTKEDLKTYYNKAVTFRTPKGVRACDLAKDATCGGDIGDPNGPVPPTTATGYPVILETRINGKKVSAVVVNGGNAGASVTVNIPKTYSKDGIKGELQSTHWEYEQRKGQPQEKISAPSSGLTPRTVKIKVGGTRVIADYKVVPTVKVQHWNAITDSLISEEVHQVTTSDNKFSASAVAQEKPLSYLYSEISSDGGRTWNQRHTNATRNIVAGPGENIIRFYYGEGDSIIPHLVITANPGEIIEGKSTTVKFTLDASGSGGKYPIKNYEFYFAEDSSELDANKIASTSNPKTTTTASVDSSGTWYGKVIVTDTSGATAEAEAEVEIEEVKAPEPLQIPRVTARGNISISMGNPSDRVNGQPIADITEYINRIEVLDSRRQLKEVMKVTENGLETVQTFKTDEKPKHWFELSNTEKIRRAEQYLKDLYGDSFDITTLLDGNGLLSMEKLQALLPTTLSEKPYWDNGRDYINVYINYPDKVYPIDPDTFDDDHSFFGEDYKWAMSGAVTVDGSASTSTNGVGDFSISGDGVETGSDTIDSNPATFEIGEGGSIRESNEILELLFDPKGSGDIGLTYDYEVIAWDSSWDDVKDKVQAGEHIGTFPSTTSECPGGDLDPNLKGCQVIAKEEYYKGSKRFTVTILRDPYAVPSKLEPNVELAINENEFIIGEEAEFTPTFTEIPEETFPITAKEWRIYGESGLFELTGQGEIVAKYPINLEPGVYHAEQTIWWKDGDENDISKTATVTFEVFEVIKPDVTLTLNGATGFPPDALEKFVLPQNTGTFEVKFYEDTRRTFPIIGKGFRIYNEDTNETVLENTIRKSDYPDLDINNPDEDNPTEAPPGWGDLSPGELKPVYNLPFDLDGGIYRASQTIYWEEDGKEQSKTVEVRFRLISPVPVARFNVHQKMDTAGTWKEVILGSFNGKQYKEIRVDLSPSTAYNISLENPHPILYTDARTQIKVIPLDNAGNPDPSKNNKVVTFVAGDRVIESNEVTIKGKEQISIRFDSPGTYKIQARVTNAYYTSKWVSKNIQIIEDKPPLVSLSFDKVQTNNPVSKYTTNRQEDLHVRFGIKATVTMADEDSPNYNSARLEIKYDYNGNNNPLDDGTHSQMLVTPTVNDVRPYVKSISKSGMKDFSIDLYEEARPILGPIQFEYSIAKNPVIPYFEGGDLPAINYPRGTTSLQAAEDKTVYVDNLAGIPKVHIGKEGKVDVTIYAPNNTIEEVLANSVATVGINLAELITYYADNGLIYILDKNGKRQSIALTDL